MFQQPDSYGSFMRKNMAEYEQYLNSKYNEMMRNQHESQYSAPPQQPIQQQSQPNFNIPAPQPQTQQSFSSRTAESAFSIEVNSIQEAGNYAVNRELLPMYFPIGDDKLCVKTFNLGAGKWNDMQIFEKIQPFVNQDNEIVSTPSVNSVSVIESIDAIKAEILKVLSDEIGALKNEIKPLIDKPKAKVGPKVIEEDIADTEEDDDEYEEKPKTSKPISKTRRYKK
jgi:hypothetical protein